MVFCKSFVKISYNNEAFLQQYASFGIKEAWDNTGKPRYKIYTVHIHEHTCELQITMFRHIPEWFFYFVCKIVSFTQTPSLMHLLCVSSFWQNMPRWDGNPSSNNISYWSPIIHAFTLFFLNYPKLFMLEV